jgi:hypothetical protein
MGHFLVERFVPSLASSDMAAAVARLAGGEDVAAVRHLWTALIPDEETCLSLFEAPDREAVERANQAARFDFDRVFEALVLIGAAPRFDDEEGSVR